MTKKASAKKRKSADGLEHPQQKGIKQKILLCMASTVIISLFLTGLISILLNYFSTNALLQQSLTETAQVAAQRVEKELEAYSNVAYDAGSIARLAKSETSIEEKKEILDQRAKTHGFVGYNLLDADGTSKLDGNDYSDREYFHQAMDGKCYISDPMISKTTGKVSIMVAAPLWKNGIPDTEVVGVVYFKPEETFLNDIVSSIQVSTNGAAYMVGKDGYTIADTTLDTIITQNIEEEAKSDTSLKQLAAIHAKMRAGESGFSSYRINGASKFSAYAPVEGTDGWSIAITAPKSDFMSATIQSTVISIVMLIAASIVAVMLARWLAAGISKPIGLCCDRLELLAKGDLDSDVPKIDRNDETGRLAASTNTIVMTLASIIGDVNQILAAFAQGDFSIVSQTKDSYTGGFTQILTSMHMLKTELGQTLSSIKEASEQVSMGSRQLAEGAQSLAEGATDQAGAVQELTATIENVSELAKQSAHDATDAYLAVDQKVAVTDGSRKEMEQLLGAMEHIRETSNQIENIIGAIEDIASQTNLLSLNASIEAARAGEAGKGFAVVAEQIGKLANDSAASAVETRELIIKIVEEIEKGGEISDAAVKAFEDVAKSMSSLSSMAHSSSDASDKQAEMLAQVEQGVEQISSVVQNNSAAAEETSATSEELSAQSESMNKLIEKFRF